MVPAFAMFMGLVQVTGHGLKKIKKLSWPENQGILFFLYF